MSTKRSIFMVVSLGFLLLNSLSLLYLTGYSNAAGREIYVDDSFSYPRDGSAEHPLRTITEAINLATDGDTVYVFSGNYNETIVINKRISLIGGIDDQPSNLSRYAEHKYLIEITTDFVTIENFVIKDPNRFISSQNGALIHITSNNVVIQKNNISDCSLWGVYLDSSDDNMISGNIINDTKGVFVFSSNNNVFSNNIISNSTDSGLNIRSSMRNILYDNNFSSNTYGVYSKDCSNMNMTQNIFTKNKFYGAFLTGDTTDVVQKNDFINNTVSGITLDSTDCIIAENVFNHGQVGINLQRTGCQIYNNSFRNMSSTALSATTLSRNNVMYLNEFFENAINAREQGSNQWDNGTIGNSWDDYNYVDRDHDGFGDRPYSIGSGRDHYPRGVFLQPPLKPSNPSPSDDRENVGLSVTLWVTISDPDSDIISEVSFYNAVNNQRVGYVRNVVNGKNASCSFTLPFDTTYAWYVVANDSLQQNQSDIWFFTTKQRPPENQKPVANPGGPYLTKLNQTVSFNGSQSIDPDGTIIFYRWNFGDGSSQILDISPEHTYADPGLYIVTLTVVDDDGRSSMANTTATIQGVIFINNPPIATCIAPMTANVGQEVTFDASLSNDTDGTIVGYRWDFNGDGTYDTDWMTTPIITWIFSAAGSFVVTLEVMDNNDAISPYSATVSVKEVQKGIPGFDIVLVFIALLIGLYLYRKSV
ncbi:MAG: PKD domain-containing protein [Candidatus Thermoplasmatota archaeon]|jgi:parallel beta-helix repeat protein|nr:PKD domain-containing protein [Candidatus Thermoplasmatota archaeon]